MTRRSLCFVIAACCSGHAFKFGPLTGRIAAELAIEGRSGVAAYADQRDRFRAEGRAGTAAVAVGEGE